jgi:hypothetical protein
MVVAPNVMGPNASSNRPGVTTVGGGNGQGAPPTFDQATRLSLFPLAAMARPAGGGFSPEVELPSYGLLAGLLLEIRGTVNGTVGTPNPLGMASIIKRVTLRLNTGTVVFSLTGPDYHYLWRPTIDSGYIDVAGQGNAYDPVTATGAILDMVIPLTANLRDPVGILLLQNRQVTLTLQVEWEADANIGSTATYSGFSVIPSLMMFSVPPQPGSLPWDGMRFVKQVVDESRVIAGAGDDVYDVPRPNVYVNIIVGAGMNATGADSWTRSFLRVNQTSYLMDFTPNKQDILYRYLKGRARELGTIHYPFLATSGLGAYGTPRDLYNTANVTNVQIVTTVTGALTRYLVREQLVDALKA